MPCFQLHTEAYPVAFRFRTGLCQVKLRAGMGRAMQVAWLSVCLSACGGTDDVERESPVLLSRAAAPVQLTCADYATGYDFLILDAFDSSSLNHSPNNYWYVSTDGSNTELGNYGPIDKGMSAAGGAPAVTKGCSASARAVHLFSKEPGFDTWGYNLGIKFEVPKDGVPDYKDASDWDGVAFWMKRTPGAPNYAPVFVVKDDDQTGDNIVLEEHPAACKSGVAEEELCDAYGNGVSPSGTDWELILLPFDEMVQRSFGKPFASLHKDKIFGLGFYLEGKVWDFWVDEMMYFRKK
jgi:hypothetical protein